MRSLKSRKQFKPWKRQSSKKRMKNKKRKLSKKLRGGMNISNMSTQTIYEKMEKLGDDINKTKNKDNLTRLIKEGDVLVTEATQRQNQTQTPEIYQKIRSKFYKFLDLAQTRLHSNKKDNVKN